MLCDVYINCSLLIPLGIPKSRFSTKQVSEHQWNKTLHTIAAIVAIAAIACDCGQLRILSAEIRFIHHHLLDGQTSIHPAYDIGSTSPNPNVYSSPDFWTIKWPQEFSQDNFFAHKQKSHSKKIPTDPWNIPQVPQHTNMKEFPSYTPNWGSGVCSRGMFEFS